METTLSSAFYAWVVASKLGAICPTCPRPAPARKSGELFYQHLAVVLYTSQSFQDIHSLSNLPGNIAIIAYDLLRIDISLFRCIAFSGLGLSYLSACVLLGQLPYDFRLCD